MSKKLPSESQGRIVVFGARQIRRAWMNDQWFFSVVDIVGALTDSAAPAKYWDAMKRRERQSSGVDLSTFCRKVRLTGADGKTYASETVNTEGAFRIDGKKFRIVDLPGAYSLLSNSSDEEVARDFILFGRPDVTVVVVDATTMERNLNLALQVLEITDRAVVAVNLMDEAERKGIRVDTRALGRDLGAPVVPMAARSGLGLPELRAAILGVASGTIQCRIHPAPDLGAEVEASLARITEAVLAEYPGLPNARWVALRLLEGDPSVVREARNGTLGDGLHGHVVDEPAAAAAPTGAS